MFREDSLKKQDMWRSRYHEPPSGIEPFIKKELENRWVNRSIETHERKPSDFNVLAIDSSYQMEQLKNGGLLYVVRALGLNGKNEYRELEADSDYTDGSAHEATGIMQRKMEYLEIKLATGAISEGFDGIILLDGSLYGRISHLVIESPLGNDRGFFGR